MTPRSYTVDQPKFMHQTRRKNPSDHKGLRKFLRKEEGAVTMATQLKYSKCKKNQQTLKQAQKLDRQLLVVVSTRRKTDRYSEC